MNRNGSKAAAPAALETPAGFPEDAVQALSVSFTRLLADMFALYIKTKNFHWHVSGPHFRDYHLLTTRAGRFSQRRTRSLSGSGRSAAPRSDRSPISPDASACVTTTRIVSALPTCWKNCARTTSYWWQACARPTRFATRKATLPARAFLRTGSTKASAESGFCSRPRGTARSSALQLRLSAEAEILVGIISTR